jgi:hypothetical protein
MKSTKTKKTITLQLNLPERLANHPDLSGLVSKLIRREYRKHFAA